jgi:hypothetical protein
MVTFFIGISPTRFRMVYISKRFVLLVKNTNKGGGVQIMVTFFYGDELSNGRSV